jgi:branched-chain amino acid transport system permease protein
MGEQLLQLLFSGLTIGSIYSLIGLTLVITFKVTGILNLAQGEFVMLGALLAVSLRSMGLPILPAYVAAILIVALLGGLLERLAIDKARGACGITLLIITIGLATALRGLALLIWGTQTYSLPSFTQGGPLLIGGAALNPQSLWIFALSAITLICISLFFSRTYWGKAVKASVYTPIGARLQGINLRTISLSAFIMAGALGTVAGIFISPITLVTYNMGFMLGVKGFVAATIGGLNSIGGAVVGGLILGLLEAYSSGLISSGLKDGISMLVLLAVLLLRPDGILGAVKERAI